MLGALALTACAKPPVLRLSLPPTAAEPCVGPDPAEVQNLRDLAGFSLAQEAALQTCEARRKALMEVIAGAGL